MGKKERDNRVTIGNQLNPGDRLRLRLVPAYISPGFARSFSYTFKEKLRIIELDGEANQRPQEIIYPLRTANHLQKLQEQKKIIGWTYGRLLKHSDDQADQEASVDFLVIRPDHGVVGLLATSTHDAAKKRRHTLRNRLGPNSLNMIGVLQFKTFSNRQISDDQLKEKISEIINSLKPLYTYINYESNHFFPQL